MLHWLLDQCQHCTNRCNEILAGRELWFSGQVDSMQYKVWGVRVLFYIQLCGVFFFFHADSSKLHLHTNRQHTVKHRLPRTSTYRHKDPQLQKHTSCSATLRTKIKVILHNRSTTKIEKLNVTTSSILDVCFKMHKRLNFFAFALTDDSSRTQTYTTGDEIISQKQQINKQEDVSQSQNFQSKSLFFA